MLATAPTGMDLMFGSSRGTGVTTFHISNNSNIPAIYCSAAGSDWIGQELERWYANCEWRLSENIFEMQIQKPISAWRVSPSKVYEDELLDWDASIQNRPARPSGNLKVTLRYAGHARPTPTRDPWD
jgi:hypothetical protein